jgi:hypothetical protein
MMFPAQTIMPARLCDQRGLVDVRIAAFLRGRSMRATRELAEGGTREGVRGDWAGRGLEWVWNVTVNPSSPKRDLRFWLREVLAPQACKGLKPAEVINLILPVTLRQFAPGRVMDLLLCDYQHLHNLKSASQLPSGRFTPREALVHFLARRRLVTGPGAVPAARELFPPEPSTHPRHDLHPG